MKVLRQFIREALSKRFDFDEFVRRDAGSDDEQVLSYLNSTLRHIGRGSARTVYVLSSKRALKFARNERGFDQNSVEVKVYESLRHKSIVPRVFAHDRTRPSGLSSWIVVELVRPVRDAKELKRLSGIRLGALGMDLTGTMPELRPAIQELKDLGLQTSDWNDVDQWGVGADGRIVLLDPGVTFEVLQKHY
jgi:hypothetical protein